MGWEQEKSEFLAAITTRWQAAQKSTVFTSINSTL